MAFGDNITYEFLINRLNKELERIRDYSEETRHVADMLYKGNYTQNELIGAVAIMISNANDIDEVISTWRQYISKYKGIVVEDSNRAVEDLKNADNEIINLKAKLSTYEGLLREKDKYIAQLEQKQVEQNINNEIANINSKLDLIVIDREQYNKLYQALKVIGTKYSSLGEIKELVDTLERVLETIDKNAKLIAASEGNREKQKHAVGTKSNRYIKELDTEELIKVYRENGNSIPKYAKEEYTRKYGITYNGLRERLIKAGVWVNRHPTDN